MYVFSELHILWRLSLELDCLRTWDSFLMLPVSPCNVRMTLHHSYIICFVFPTSILFIMLPVSPCNVRMALHHSYIISYYPSYSSCFKCHAMYVCYCCVHVCGKTVHYFTTVHVRLCTVHLQPSQRTWSRTQNQLRMIPTRGFHVRTNLS